MNFQEAYNRIKNQVEKLGIFQFKEEWSEAECITAFETAENKNLVAIEDSQKRINLLETTIKSLHEKIEGFESSGFLTKETVLSLVVEKITEANSQLSSTLKTEFANEVEGIKKLATTSGAVVTGDGKQSMGSGASDSTGEEEMVEVRTKLFNQDATIKVKKSQIPQFQK